jgi:hypothetical protein
VPNSSVPPNHAFERPWLPSARAPRAPEYIVRLRRAAALIARPLHAGCGGY